MGVRLSCPYASKVYKWLTLIAGLLALWFCCSVVAYEYSGGYGSIKTVGGAASSVLTIGRTGVPSPYLALGTGPTLNTLPATNVAFGAGGTQATLQGALTSLRGFPRATVWFEWGYNTAYGNTVGVQTATTTGTYTFNLTGYDPAQTVYCRFVGKTDGVAYGAARSFLVGGGRSTGYRLLWNILLLIMALGVLLVGIRIGTSVGWIPAIILIITGIVGLVVVRTILLGMW